MNTVRRLVPWLLPPAVVGGLIWALTPPAYPGDVKVLMVLIAVVALTLSRAEYLLLSRSLGRATAYAGIAVSWAVLFAVAFTASPDCFTTTVAHRCTPKESGTWAVAGALMVLTALVLTVLPVWVATKSWTLLKWVRRLTSGTTATTSDTPEGPAPTKRSDVTSSATGTVGDRLAARRADLLARAGTHQQTNAAAPGTTPESPEPTSDDESRPGLAGSTVGSRSRRRTGHEAHEAERRGKSARSGNPAVRAQRKKKD